MDDEMRQCLLTLRQKREPGEEAEPLRGHRVLALQHDVVVVLLRRHLVEKLQKILMLKNVSGGEKMEVGKFKVSKSGLKLIRY